MKGERKMIDLIDEINRRYDIRKEHESKIDIDFEYEPNQVTAIIGESGTGKTTLLRKWFNVEDVTFEVDSEKAIFEVLFEASGRNFDETSKLLFDVGLTSVPVWKNKFYQISNGEKLRFEIAMKLTSADKVIFIDEFTSMLDRQTAKNLSLNVNKLVTKYDKELVISTCHFDILDWIKIDRLVDTTSKKSYSPQDQMTLTLTTWKSMKLNETCGEHLNTITICRRV